MGWQVSSADAVALRRALKVYKDVYHPDVFRVLHNVARTGTKRASLGWNSIVSDRKTAILETLNTLGLEYRATNYKVYISFTDEQLIALLSTVRGHNPKTLSDAKQATENIKRAMEERRQELLKRAESFNSKLDSYLELQRSKGDTPSSS